MRPSSLAHKVEPGHRDVNPPGGRGGNRVRHVPPWHCVGRGPAHRLHASPHPPETFPCTCPILGLVRCILAHRRTFFLIFGMLAAAPLQGERFNVATYTNQDGLPQRQVMAIAQDQHGYLWLGTYGGLSRFNGRVFSTLRTSEGLSSNAVQDIIAGPSGMMWVGTSGGGVCQVVFPHVRRCFRAPDELLSDDVLDLEEDGRGGVWVGTFGGISHLDASGRSTHYPTAQARALRNVWVIRQLAGRTLAGHDGGIAQWEGDRWTPLEMSLPPIAVRSVAETSGKLWVGSESGLFVIPTNSPLTGGTAVLPRIFVQDLLARGDTIWVASRSGLYRLEEGQLTHFTSREGIEAEVIHRVFQDREDNVWLGTDGGLHKLVLGPITTLTTANGLPHPFVRAVGEDGAGRLLIGTRDGILVRGVALQHVIPGRLLPGPRVYAFLPRPDGSVWVATSGGVAILRAQRLEATITTRDGLPSTAIFALAPAEDGSSVWVAGWSGLALVRGRRCLPLPSEIASLRALTLAPDGAGGMWVGLRDGGLAHLDHRWRVRILRASEGFTDQVVWSIARQGDSTWFATNGDGALRLVGEQVERWDRRRGLVDDFVWQVLADRRGRTWLFTSQGLDRLDGKTIRHFDRGDGLPDLEGSANAAWEGRDGVLWFGTAVGLVRYDPRRDLQAPRPPPVLLESALREDGSPLLPGSTLPPRPGAITFSLTSLSFRNERAIRFSYRLLPVQPQWSQPTADPEIRYASLGAGRYSLEAVAVASDGSRSTTPATLSFAVALPWWRLPWAWAALLAGALALAFGWARWRVARSEALAQRLEEEVRARTAELARKQEELEWLAATDELTGLPNRRRFFEVARQELQRLSRSPAEVRLALVVLDLDGFKSINDTLGHTAGDAVLRAVGRALRGAVRGTDTVARFGGDEFAAILPMTDRPGATLVAAKLIQAIESVLVTWEGRQLSVSASAGLAVVAPSAVFEEQEVARVVQRADLALYAAKRRGGGCLLDDGETWA